MKARAMLNGKLVTLYENDFEKSLITDFWEARGFGRISTEHKEKIWNIIMDSIFDKILIKYDIGCSFSIVGREFTKLGDAWYLDQEIEETARWHESRWIRFKYQIGIPIMTALLAMTESTRNWIGR